MLMLRSGRLVEDPNTGEVGEVGEVDVGVGGGFGSEG